MREHNKNGGGETIEMWWSDGKITTISSPGFSPTRPYGTRERYAFGEQRKSAKFLRLRNSGENMREPFKQSS